MKNRFGHQVIQKKPNLYSPASPRRAGSLKEKIHQSD